MVGTGFGSRPIYIPTPWAGKEVHPQVSLKSRKTWGVGPLGRHGRSSVLAGDVYKETRTLA